MIVFAELSVGHFSSQTESVEQLTEQGEAEQVTLHVEFPVQDTLPLAPTVTVQVECDAQLIVHEAPHVPVHVLWSVQLMEQLVGPHVLELNEQDCPLVQVHVDPLQVGGGAPHPNRSEARRRVETTTDASRFTWAPEGGQG